jgi:hypothetical protein
MKNIYVLSLCFLGALLAQPLNAAEEPEERPERINLPDLLFRTQEDDALKLAAVRQPADTPEDREAFVYNRKENWGSPETVDQHGTSEREIEIVTRNGVLATVTIYKSNGGDFYLPTTTGSNPDYVRFIKPERQARRSQDSLWRIAFNPKTKIFGFTKIKP